MELYFYYADTEYVNFLKDYEKNIRGFTCVPNTSYRSTDKFLFGAVLTIHGVDYYVPVSSYSKDQHDNILIRDKAKTEILGSLRFTYMIPIPEMCRRKVDINALNRKGAIAHVSKELAFCRRNRDKIIRQAEKTYKRVIEKRDKTLIRNSCDFLLLERACLEYCRIHDIPSGTEQITAEVT